jgi:hypothetical protein
MTLHRPIEPSPATNSATGAVVRDRSSAWLALVRRLTARIPDWAVMKNFDSALHGTGDVDSVGALAVWPIVEQEFRAWAFEHGLGPVIACRHVRQVLHLVALDPHDSLFFELDVNRRKIFLGSTLFYPRDLLALSTMDPRGFRRVRAGTEGVLKLVQNGAKRGGRPNWDGIRRKRIVELLSEDPVGVQGGAKLFGAGADAVMAVVQSVLAGRWNRHAMLTVEAWSLLRGLGNPLGLLARVRFRIVKRRCPVLQAVFDASRRVPEDREAWLREVARSHPVYWPASARAQ